jgi:hypothetical protein
MAGVNGDCSWPLVSVGRLIKCRPWSVIDYIARRYTASQVSLQCRGFASSIIFSQLAEMGRRIRSTNCPFMGQHCRVGGRTASKNGVVRWTQGKQQRRTVSGPTDSQSFRARIGSRRAGSLGKTWPGNYSRSILAARMKSLSVRPLILCVQVVTSALPQDSRMSG